MMEPSLKTVQLRANRRLKGMLKISGKIRGLMSRRSLAGGKIPLSAEVRLVASPAMIQLNRKYRGKTYATDVLSFESLEIFRMQGFLGEIVICFPTLRRQAQERGLSLEMELEILLAHGLLHLLGWDHERSKAEAEKMSVLERRILAQTVPQAWIKKTRGACLQGLIGFSKREK